ncbi:hypothetical protein [Streptomyces netropsis]|uniref:Uncharacterized protein n=1 Tax=Streptomyces netropsis TaxID=55404 RepID=A0A7W7L7C5_STRNE|nr:hypothetical protein [Streptomyces netropsis]MBB4884401.1 hypothetical protein [Streptomyces netropsis]GGR03940.1 cytochrome c biogenesis protein [Streptomyces netropsis]
MARLKIEISVPDDHVEKVTAALHASGAGRVGGYERCTSVWRIDGTWQPMPGADPYDGEVGVLQHATESRIESFCDTDQAAAVLRAVRAAHPYEEPVIHFLPLYEPGED